MSGRRHDRWLLIRLAAQNVGSRRLRAMFLGAAALPIRLGETVSVCGMPMSISGRLGKTGVGPFDESYFLSFDALAEIVSFCRRSDARPKSAAPAKVDEAPAVARMSHAAVCSGDLQLDRVSAFLLQLSPAAKVEDVKFA